MSVPCVTDPLVPVTRSVKLPIDAAEVVVIAIGELAAPPGGGVMGDGNAKVIPDGAFPIQEAVKVTGPLNPPVEVTTIVAELLSPSIIGTVDMDDDRAKLAPGGITAGVVLMITGTFTIRVDVPVVPLTVRT